MSTHTPGPWRWEYNAAHRTVNLVGGEIQYDLIVLEPSRWGMNGATLMLRDPAHDGMQLLHKLHERPDWIAPLPGRAHHASWCATIAHPDARLIAAAPDLLAALQDALEYLQHHLPEEALVSHRAAIAKATGGRPCSMT